METAQDLITDAWVDAGVGAVADALESANAQAYLRRLNRMLDSWNTERLNVYELYNVTLSTVAGTASYASSALSGSLRPIRVENAIVTSSGVDFGLEVITPDRYQNLAYKADTGLPQYVYVQGGMPAATLWFWPTPDAVYTVTLGVRRPLPTTLTLTTSLSLPPGYQKAIVDNLALEIAGASGMAPTPSLVASARESKANIKAMNLYIPELDSPFAREKPSIIRGY